MCTNGVDVLIVVNNFRFEEDILVVVTVELLNEGSASLKS